jgi:restriction system protein
LAEQRADALTAAWNDAAARRQAQFGDAAARFAKFDAEERTAEAERVVAAMSSILIRTVQNAPATDWSPLHDDAVYGEAEPAAPPPPQTEIEPKPSDFPRAPLTLATLIRPSALRRRRQTAEAKFDTAHNGWLYLKRWREKEYDKALAAHRSASQAWQERRGDFLARQARANAHLEGLVAGYRNGDAAAVTGLCDLNLLSLPRPAGFPCFWTMRYDAGALEVDYDLPSLDVVPVLKAVKYVPSRGAFDVVAFPEAERERIYGEAVFQTALAVVHTLFAGDALGAIKAVAFNGWANYVDGGALRPGRACILSLTTDKSLFQTLDLASVDPQACFRALNGVMSPKLAALVAPALS